MVFVKNNKNKKVCLNRIVSEKINTGVSGFINYDFKYDEFYDNKIIKYNDNYDEIEKEVYSIFNVPIIL